MSVISLLWNEQRLPIRDGLYFSDGRAYSVRISAAMPGGIEICAEFDLDAVTRAEPDWLTRLDITRETELGSGAGFLCCGEGSYGSEGFLAMADDSRGLVWVVYLAESNPFTDIVVNGALATFVSTSGVSVTVDIRAPESAGTTNDLT